MTDKRDDAAAANTDRELWRERDGDYYADSIHVTESGGIGINCGGTVIVMPLRAWYAIVAKRDALKAALRKVALRSNDRGNWCECCDGSWLGLSPERHADGCLAAPEDAP